jgi:hypothetical protein
VAALVVAFAAAIMHLPAALVLLSLVWFGPALLRRTGAMEPLDERETEVNRVAQQISLSVLLVLVTVLPFLLTVGDTRDAPSLRSEWLDVGFLVVVIFYLRAAVMLNYTVPRAVAAHTAGLAATLTAALGVMGNALFYPGQLPPIFFFVLPLCLLPHAAAFVWKPLAALLWAGGAGFTALVIAGLDSPLEVVVAAGLLVVPWALAAYWIFTVRNEA